MSWIQTFSGLRFSPQAARPEDFRIEDIAHALSLQCRFNGHCLVFYSVAEHSLRVSRICPPEAALWGLLHDMAEAYVSDLPRPIKAQFPRFGEMEEALLRLAAEVFGLEWPVPEVVRRADDILLATEARDLMAPPPEPWGLLLPPLEERIAPIAAAEAEQAFLARYRELR